jgi:hypothetical protein
MNVCDVMDVWAALGIFTGSPKAGDQALKNLTNATEGSVRNCMPALKAQDAN